MIDTPMGETAAALAEIRRLVEVGFTRTDGQNSLILQRMDHADGRHTELVKRVDQDRTDTTARGEALERRLDTVEREAVTRVQLADRTKQIIAILGLLVTIVGVIITVVSLTLS